MNAKDAAEIVVKMLEGAGTVAPEPFGALIRIAAATIGAAAEALDNGTSEADLIAHIHRVRHIAP